MQPRYIGGSAADARSLDVDLIGSGSRLPRQVRERSCGWTVDHSAVESKFRPVAWAYEMPLSVIECVRAAEVWTRDRECVQLPILASHVAGERRVALRVVLTSVGHDERDAGRRVKPRSSSLAKSLQGSIQCDANLLLHQFGIARREQVHGHRCDHGDDR